jgi:hypothetical protein
MQTDRRSILEGLADGKISINEAEDLLSGLDRSGANSNDTKSSPSNKARFVRIAVDAPGAEQVNVRFPLTFLRSGMKVLGILPAEACEKLIELTELARATQDATESQNHSLEIDCGNRKTVRLLFE